MAEPASDAMEADLRMTCARPQPTPAPRNAPRPPELSRAVSDRDASGGQRQRHSGVQKLQRMPASSSVEARPSGCSLLIGDSSPAERRKRTNGAGPILAAPLGSYPTSSE